MAYPTTLADWISYFKANGICQDPAKGLQQVIDFQDYVGRRTIEQTVNEIIDICNTSTEVSLDNICWAMAATLDINMAGEIIKLAMWRLQGQSLEEKIREEQESLFEIRHRNLEDQYCRKLQRAEDEAQRQKERVAELARRLVDAQAECDRLREQMSTVRSAVSILRAV